jgi:hypothetical protein
MGRAGREEKDHGITVGYEYMAGDEGRSIADQSNLLNDRSRRSVELKVARSIGSERLRSIIRDPEGF